MSDLSVGDVLIGEIQAWKRNQLELSIIATDAGRARWIPPNNNQLTAICLAPKVNFSIPARHIQLQFCISCTLESV